MPVNPADSLVMGTLYGSDAMRAVFDETAYFQRMLDVEAALARVLGRLGVIPAEAASLTAGSRCPRPYRPLRLTPRIRINHQHPPQDIRP